MFPRVAVLACSLVIFAAIYFHGVVCPNVVVSDVEAPPTISEDAPSILTSLDIVTPSQEEVL